MSRNDNPWSKLRNMLSSKRTIVAPGVFSPIIAKIASDLGYEALYFSGGGFANLMGMPDLGVTTLTEVVEAVRRISSFVKLPIIVDADTGFGEAVNVMRTFRELRSAGAAAIHIEDQVMPKRCGHLDGKEIVEVDEMVKKIMTARRASNEGPLLIARTDARSVEGLDSAIERARLYVKAGADIIFPEALESMEEFKEFRAKIDAPLLANMTEFGKTPYITVSEFEKIGYNIVIFPMTAFRAMLKTVKEVLMQLRYEGTQKNMLNKLMQREEIYKIINYNEYQDLDSEVMKEARELLHITDR